MNDMEEKRDNKEIRVRLHHIDRGNCTEVWEVQTEKGKPRRYLGRDDGYGPKEWYTLCDAPYGYCERDCHVREDLTLIVCDKDWNEVLRDGTDITSNVIDKIIKTITKKKFFINILLFPNSILISYSLFKTNLALLSSSLLFPIKTSNSPSSLANTPSSLVNRSISSEIAKDTSCSSCGCSSIF